MLQLLAGEGQEITLEPDELFLHVARTGSKSELRKLIEDQSELLARMHGEHPDIIKQLASPERSEMLDVLIEMGFDVNARAGGSRTTALPDAAGSGDIELARLLIDLGADPDIRDAYIGAKPLGWAQHFNHYLVAICAHAQRRANRGTGLSWLCDRFNDTAEPIGGQASLGSAISSPDHVEPTTQSQLRRARPVP